MFDKVIGHAPFLGHTGYANHAREFFTHLSKLIPTRVRNFTHVSDPSYLTEFQKNLLFYQRFDEYEIGRPFNFNIEEDIVNLILFETNHVWYYEDYAGPKIAYNVWESTKQPENFFRRLLDFDQLWVPSKWQAMCSVEQGFPANRVKVVPEGVDGNIFYPVNKQRDDAFYFMFFGRWEHRKSVTEMVKAFKEEFKETPDVRLVLSADNPFPSDGMSNTYERLMRYGLVDDKIIVLHFPPFQNYVKWLQTGHCLISCARSEGWNLPLIEAIACGIPTICSNFSGQLEFAEGISHLVKINGYDEPKRVFGYKDGEVPGMWAEPDFDHLKKQMRFIYENYAECRKKAIIGSVETRKKFSWENAAKLAMHHLEEFHKNRPKRSLLNLGCGNDIKKNWINVDTFNNKKGIDYNMDIRELGFKDETHDGVYLSHTLEHFDKNDVPIVLKEMNRVIRMGSMVEIIVPEFMTCVQAWLDADDKWSALEHIFGSQTHPGNHHFVGFTVKTLEQVLENHGFKCLECAERNNPITNHREIRALAFKVDDLKPQSLGYNYHFVNGPFFELLGSKRREYKIEFLDIDNDAMVHSAYMKPGMWVRPHRKYFTNWRIQLKEYGKVIWKHDYNPKGQRILISLDSKALGDTIAWMPYIEEFRKKYDCHVIATTFWNNLFKEVYPEIDFFSPGMRIDNLYAQYIIGCKDSIWENKSKWWTIPLQQVATDYLGLDYKEIKPKIKIPAKKKLIKGKYVCISEHSTSQFKYWNYPGGWQTVVNWLKKNNYKVVVISKEETKLKNIINKTNSPINHTMTSLKYCDAFIGGPSGLSWLAWAMGIPVVMITGITEPWCEFKTGIKRVTNTNVCHGCFNDPNFKFDKSWDYCPRHKGTERQFECTKNITPEDVIKQLDFLINSKEE